MVAVKTPAPQRAAGRRALQSQGKTMPGTTSFPTPNVTYWHKALDSVGRVPAGKRPALASYLKKRAQQLGITSHVKGTWLDTSPNKPATAMANGAGPSIDLAAAARTRRLPVVRGPADVQLTRAATGAINAAHKSTGMKIGTISPSSPQGRGYVGTHGDGTVLPAAGTPQAALAGLIAHHNAVARAPRPGRGLVPAQQMGAAVFPGAAQYAARHRRQLDLAGALPVTSSVASSSDGPRVTTASSGSGSPAKGSGNSSAPAGLSAYAAGVYRKLLAKKMKPAVALAFAKRADAMHAKAAGGQGKASAA